MPKWSSQKNSREEKRNPPPKGDGLFGGFVPLSD
jgi:hypothetical protein